MNNAGDAANGANLMAAIATNIHVKQLKRSKVYFMAAYEFKCMVCGMTETITRDINADGDVAAPQCRGCMIPMERMWSLGGIQFKGTGWGHQ